MPATRTRLTDLNLDVLDYLTELLSHKSTNDLFLFMRTCRAIYEIGIRHLLADVSLNDNGELEGFSRFILAKRHYPRYLRTLGIYHSMDDDEVNWKLYALHLMADVLALAVNLQILELEYSGPALRACPQLLENLIQSKKLEALHLLPCRWLDGFCSPDTLSLVSKLRAPLQALTLSVALPPPGERHHDAIMLRGPSLLSAIAPFASSLKSLELQVIQAAPWSEQVDVVFNHVSDLTLECCDIDVRVLESAFPRVTNLVIHDSGEVFHNIWARNIEHRCIVWRHIPRVSGDPLAIAGAFLRGCSVGYLCFKAVVIDLAGAVVLVKDTIQNTQPVMLSIVLHVQDSLNLLEGISHVAHNLQMLEIHLCDDRAEHSPSLTYDALMHLSVALSGFRQLRHLRISVRGDIENHNGPQEYTFLDRNARNKFVESLTDSVKTLSIMDVRWALAGWDRIMYRAFDYHCPGENGSEGVGCRWFFEDHTLESWFKRPFDSYVEFRLDNARFNGALVPVTVHTGLTESITALREDGFLILTASLRWAFKTKTGMFRYLDDEWLHALVL